MTKALLGHYARALFELAKEDRKEADYLEDLALVDKTLKDNPEVNGFLASRQVFLSQKDWMIDEIFSKVVNPPVLAFLLIVVKKHLSKDFDVILERYRHLYHQEMGILEGRVYAPFELSDEQLRKLEAVFSRDTGKKVSLKAYIDKRVIGGMKVYLGDSLVDYSLDTKIDTIKDKLLYKEAR